MPPDTHPVRNRLTTVLKKAQGLPTLPNVVTKINELVNDPKVPVDEVAKVISVDPSLSAKILRVVNSPFYGMQTRVSTIKHAAVILGSTTIRSIALSSTMFDVFRSGDQTPGFDRTEFWKHSIGCGAAAKALARRVGHPVPDELFMGGLLHDAGKILTEKFARDKFREAVERASSGNLLLLDAEQEILGISHAEVGALLFKAWNLSPQLVESTEHHHTPGKASLDPQFTTLIHVADVLVRALGHGNGGDNRIPALDVDACRKVGIGTADLDAILSEAAAEIDNSAVFLEFL